MFNTGPLFLVCKNAVADLEIFQGGTDSGKTYAIIQYLVYIARCTPSPDSDPIISILSESVPNSKKGAYRTFQNIARSNEFIMSGVSNWNEGDRTIYFSTGWVMEFLGATDEQNAKQGKRQYLFVNEANGVPYSIFWQMSKRTRIRTFIDYNPSVPFWVHEKLIGTVPSNNDLYATVKLTISDHRHNPFLSVRDHEKTEGIKDKELWRVYARGLTGNLHGLIYTDWKYIEDIEYPWDEAKWGGIDFGYTNDPTAAVRVSKIADSIFIHELCYKTGIPAQQIRALYLAQKFGPEDPIYCEHDGDMIKGIRGSRPTLLAVPAKKGPNSVTPGIFKVKTYTIYATASSKNLADEKSKYMWLRDKVTNKLTNAPVDTNNHLMDAVRYAITTHLYRNPN